jgi:hypothetical protein
MALEVLLTKRPYEVSLSGNPIPFVFAVTPYTSNERAQDIRLQVIVQIENIFNSGTFDDVRRQNFYPDNEGQIAVDVQSIIDPYLDYYMPKMALARPVQANNQRKRFRLKWLLQLNAEAVTSVITGDTYYAVKGGLSREEWHPFNFFSDVIVNQKKGLYFQAAGEKVGVTESRFFYWIYPLDDIAQQSVIYTITLSDGSEVDVSASSTVNCGKWGVCCVPAGFNHIGLDGAVPSDKFAVGYRISVVVGLDATVIATATFTIDNRNFYNTTELLYRTSIGGLDTIRLRGQIDYESDYSAQTAQRTTPPSWFQNQVLLPQTVTTAATEASKTSGNTGFISKEHCDKLRDLFLSEQRFELVSGKLIPITVINKNTKFFSNNDSLIALQVEWNKAFVNQYYTPKQLMPGTSACPSLESFTVKQLTKNLLHIIYAAPIPYDRVEVQVITGTDPQDTQTYYFTGNAKSFPLTFNNPSVGDPVEITVKGRVLCDEDSDPVDAGAWSTQTINVGSNSLPVANNDTYNIPAGYNSAVALSGSVLANDYDPDGDGIVCTDASGATAQGGTYSINAAGNITYTPPSSSFNGQDSFDYEIQEVGGGTPVSATVYVNVGVAVSNVYCRLVIRNFSMASGNYLFTSNGEIWVDFFTDPTGTNPIDVTSLALTLKMKKSYFTQWIDGVQNTDETLTDYFPTGNKIKLYEGDLYYENYDTSWAAAQINKTEFFIQPGVGYIEI